MILRWIDMDTALARLNAWGADDRPFFFLTDYLHRRWLVEHIDELSADELLYAFPGHSNAPRKEENAVPLIWQSHPLSSEAYHEKFEIVHRNMLAGNSYLANLTCRIPLDTNLSLREIFLHSQARYRLWVKDAFVCFSPETFVLIRDGVISSYPMKGTISCNVPNAEQTLLNDVKEAAEHATIVDLIRNDLSRVADHVSVRRYRYVERLETCNGPILQTSSEIAGQLPDDYRRHLGDILMAQLPAGSITGAPKPKTMAIIREAEGYERGFYTGVAGICDHGQMESCVLIRFIDKEEGRLFFKAGGGITAKSDWQKEYQEIKEKTYVPIC
jgi:para-aminobenzoate synthetase component 1